MKNKANIIKSENVYDGRILSLRVDTIELPDMKYAKREVVDHKKGVGIVAFASPDEIWMVKQYRIAVDQDLWEIPAGLVENNEVPAETAKRELQEEVGYFPEKLDYLFDCYSSPGFTNDKLSLFLARDLRYDPLDPDDDEFLKAKTFKLEDLYQKILNGEITDAKTIIGIQYAYFNFIRSKAE